MRGKGEKGRGGRQRKKEKKVETNSSGVDIVCMHVVCIFYFSGCLRTLLFYTNG